MSSIIFVIREQEAMVATDTLATSNGKASFFTTKTLIVPHLKMMIAGTGVAGFADMWAACVNSRMLVKGIDDLDNHTPGNLAAIWVGYKEQLSIAKQAITTIYHFGFSENTGLIRCFVYGSENGFKSEPVSEGDYVRPKCAISDGYQYPKDIRKMMEEQRAIQSRLPKGKRLHIGGEIQVHHLTKAGFSVETLDQFDDYERHKNEMHQQHKNRAS
jgi:hypothetical protein